MSRLFKRHTGNKVTDTAIVSAAAAGADDGESRLHVMAPDGDEPGDEPFEGEGTTTLTIPATTVSNR